MSRWAMDLDAIVAQAARGVFEDTDKIMERSFTGLSLNTNRQREPPEKVAVRQSGSWRAPSQVTATCWQMPLKFLFPVK